MTDVKYKPLEPLSGWLEFKLISDKLDPPVFRCRLRPIDMFNLIDGLGAGGKFQMGRATVEASIEAVAEWDLAVEGTPIPLTPENKTAWLRPIIAEPVLGYKEGTLLGTAIVIEARERGNFLKN